MMPLFRFRLFSFQRHCRLFDMLLSMPLFFARFSPFRFSLFIFAIYACFLSYFRYAAAAAIFFRATLLLFFFSFLLLRLARYGGGE